MTHTLACETARWGWSCLRFISGAKGSFSALRKGHLEKVVLLDDTMAIVLFRYYAVRSESNYLHLRCCLRTYYCSAGDASSGYRRIHGIPLFAVESTEFRLAVRYQVLVRRYDDRCN